MSTEELNDATSEDINAAFEAGASEDLDQEPQTATEAMEQDGNKAATAPDIKATPEAPPAPQFSPEILSALNGLPELERRLTQQVDKVAGNYGEVKRLIDTIQKSSQATPQGAAATARSMTKLRELGFDELADAIADDLGTDGTEINPESIAKIAADAVSKANADAEVNAHNKAVSALDRDHPDRVEIRESSSYKDWLASLSETKRNRFLTSWSPEYVSERLDEFKDWRSAKAAEQARTDADATKAAARLESKSRLEAAVTPSGRSRGGPITTSIHDAFLQGAGEA